MLLEGKTALVTGGGSGIGRSIALAYAREGAQVLVADVDEMGGRETVELVRSLGVQVAYQRLDVSRLEEHLRAVDAVQRVFGGLHIACNNAGISSGRSRAYLPLADVATDDWDQVIGVNLTGMFYGLKAQIPALIEAGGGAVVNIASVMGQVARQGIGPYVASKHGVVGLTRAAAIDYAGKGIRVNAVGPGYIDTPMLSHADSAARARLVSLHPIGRLGYPDEIAEVVVWLSSNRASFITGGYYPVDGGYLAQ